MRRHTELHVLIRHILNLTMPLSLYFFIRWTWGLTGLQMLSFMGIIFVVEPRRLRLMQGHMQVCVCVCFVCVIVRSCRYALAAVSQCQASLLRLKHK